MSQTGFLRDLVSNLGPFFFTVVINDFPKNLNVGYVLYVDYTSLYASQNDLLELQATMEEAQADAVNWLSSNKLHCNQNKTQNLQSVELLENVIHTTLSRVEHVDIIEKYFAYFRNIKLLHISLPYLWTACFGLFQSHISHGLLLWSLVSSVNKTILIQKKVIRY